jgi:hypothetical protein
VPASLSTGHMFQILAAWETRVSWPCNGTLAKPAEVALLGLAAVVSKILLPTVFRAPSPPSRLEKAAQASMATDREIERRNLCR